jgi:presequence protease
MFLFDIFLNFNNFKDAFETLTMSILSRLLFDNPRGPLYKAVISSGVAKNFVEYFGYQSDFSETFFNIGVSGISESDISKVEEIINRTLLEASKNGFPKRDIEALLNRIELKFKFVIFDEYDIFSFQKMQG